MEHRRQELVDRADDLRLSRLELENKTKEMEQLEIEKNQLSFHLQSIQDSVTSPVIMVNDENIVTSWNKKAKEMLGLETDKAIGKNLFEIDLMKDKRLIDANSQCQQDKKSVTVKSVGIKDLKGNRIMTDVSHTPLFDSNEEFSGSIIVINDISKAAETQVELEQKQEELENLKSRFQETFRKLSLVNREIEVTNEELKESRLELDDKDNRINELENELSRQENELKSEVEKLRVAEEDILEKNNEISKIKTELESRLSEIENKNNELNQIKTNLQNREEELESRNKDIEFINIELCM